MALVNELAMFARDARHRRVGDARRGRPPSRSGSCASRPARAWAATACRSTRRYLSWARRAASLGRPFRFVELANDVNDHMPELRGGAVEHALQRRGVALADARILTRSAWRTSATRSDARESPSVAVSSCWLAGGDDVAVADPHVVEDVTTRRSRPAGSPSTPSNT